MDSLVNSTQVRGGLPSNPRPAGLSLPQVSTRRHGRRSTVNAYGATARGRPPTIRSPTSGARRPEPDVRSPGAVAPGWARWEGVGGCSPRSARPATAGLGGCSPRSARPGTAGLGGCSPRSARPMTAGVGGRSAQTFVATAAPTRDELCGVIARLETIEAQRAKRSQGEGDGTSDDGMEGLRRTAGGRGAFARRRAGARAVATSVARARRRARRVQPARGRVRGGGRTRRAPDAAAMQARSVPATSTRVPCPVEYNEGSVRPVIYSDARAVVLLARGACGAPRSPKWIARASAKARTRLGRKRPAG